MAIHPAHETIFEHSRNRGSFGVAGIIHVLRDLSYHLLVLMLRYFLYLQAVFLHFLELLIDIFLCNLVAFIVAHFFSPFVAALCSPMCSKYLSMTYSPKYSRKCLNRALWSSWCFLRSSLTSNSAIRSLRTSSGLGGLPPVIWSWANSYAS